MLLNGNFDFDFDFKVITVMQWSPYPEVCTLTNGNGRYILKLNDYKVFIQLFGLITKIW